MDDRKDFDLIPQDEFNQNHSIPANQSKLNFIPTGKPYAGSNPTPLQNQTRQQRVSDIQDSVEGDLSFLFKPSKLPDLINKGAKAFRLPEIAGGALQGGYDIAKSLADLIPGINVADMNLKQFARPDPISQIAFEGGGVIPETFAYLEGYGALGKIPKLGSNSLISTVARGGLTGFALGENAPGGREGGAAIGAVGAPFYELQTKGIADRVLARKNEMQSKYKGLYNDFFDSLKSKGLEKINGVNPDSFNLGSISNAPGFSEKYISPLKKYIEEPTFENAHKAQMDLGKLQTQVSKVARLRALTNDESDALKNIVMADKKIHGQGFRELVSKGNEKAAQDYLNLGKGYKKDVVPYFDKSIRDYEKGDVTSSYLVKNLPNRAKFQQTAGLYHQDLGRYGNFKNIANNVTTGLGYGLMNNLLSRIGLKRTQDEYLGSEDNQ